MPYSPPAYSTPTQGIVGKGTILGYASTSGGTPTLLAEMSDATHPQVNGGSAEATHYQSPSGAEEKVVNGWTNISDFDCVLTYIKSQHATVLALVNVPQYFTETLPDGSTYKFYGWITKIGGQKIPNKEVIKVPVTITVTGVMTFTPYAGS